MPDTLKERRLLALDIRALIAGTKYRASSMTGIKALMREATEAEAVILFVDELHTLVGAGAAQGAMERIEHVKPALARGS